MSIRCCAAILSLILPTWGWESPTFPALAATPQGFCPKGWSQVGDAASGDLNGDGVTDVALAFEAPDPQEDTGDGKDKPERILVVAFGDGLGRFRLICTGIPIPQPGTYGVKEDVPSVRIQRGTLLVSEDGGSAGATYSSTFRYRHEGSRWIQIGETWEGDTWAAGPDGEFIPGATLHDSTDTNLITGSVEETREVVARMKHGEVDETRLVRTRHRLLRATRSSAPPLNGDAAKVAWDAYPLRMRESRAMAGHGIPLVADLRGLYDGPTLWLQIVVRGGDSEAPVEVHLLDGAGHAQLPDRGTWMPEGDGGIWTGAFTGKDDLAWASDSIEIRRGKHLLSTAGSGHGQILPSEDPGLPSFPDDRR